MSWFITRRNPREGDQLSLDRIKNQAAFSDTGLVRYAQVPFVGVDGSCRCCFELCTDLPQLIQTEQSLIFVSGHHTSTHEQSNSMDILSEISPGAVAV